MRCSGLAWRSVTHPALAGCAPSLPRIAITRSFREDVADLGVRIKMSESTVMKPIRKQRRYEPGTFADDRYSRIYGHGIRNEAFISPRLKEKVYPFATKAVFTATGGNHALNQKHPNHTVQLTSSLAVCCRNRRFGLALSHASCLSRLRAFAAPACNHAQFPGGCS